MASADFWNDIIHQHAEAVAKVSTPDTYRGWRIYQGRWPEPPWSAASPNYDAWTDDEGHWTDNGEKADSFTREGLIAEIDAWFEENGGAR